MPQVASQLATVLSAVALGALASAGLAGADVVRPQPVGPRTVTPKVVEEPGVQGPLPTSTPGPRGLGGGSSQAPSPHAPGSGPARTPAPAPSGTPAPSGGPGVEVGGQVFPPAQGIGVVLDDAFAGRYPFPFHPECGLSCTQRWYNTFYRWAEKAPAEDRAKYQNYLQYTSEKIRRLGGQPGQVGYGASQGDSQAPGAGLGGSGDPAGEDGSLFGLGPSVAEATGLAAVEDVAKGLAQAVAAALMPVLCGEKKTDGNGVSLCPK